MGDRIGVADEEIVRKDGFGISLIGIEGAGDLRAVVQTREKEIEHVRSKKIDGGDIRFEFEALLDPSDEINQNIDRKSSGQIGVVADPFSIGLCKSDIQNSFTSNRFLAPQQP